MKLVAEIGENKFEVEVARDGSNVIAKVDGREYILYASEPETGVVLLKHDNTVYEAMVSSNTAGAYKVELKGRSHEIRIVDPKRLRGSESGSGHDPGHAEIRTAMPGKIVRILKRPGDAVEKGDGVIVVEAMKMQNEMRSPRDGSISEIRFVEGDTVAAGDILVVIE